MQTQHKNRTGDCPWPDLQSGRVVLPPPAVYLRAASPRRSCGRWGRSRRVGTWRCACGISGSSWSRHQAGRCVGGRRAGRSWDTGAGRREAVGQAGRPRSRQAGSSAGIWRRWRGQALTTSDRSWDRQAGRQVMVGQAGGQAGRQAGRKVIGQAGRCPGAGGQAGRQAGRPDGSSYICARGEGGGCCQATHTVGV